MRSDVHRVLAPLALLTLGAPGGALAQTGVANSSPFLPPSHAGAVAPTPSAGGLEFVAVVGAGAKTTVGLYDSATKKSRWIPVGGQVDGVEVLTYDVRRERIVIRTGGAEKALTLRKERGVQNGSGLAAPPVVGFTPPAPTLLSEGVVAPRSVAAASVAVPAVGGGPMVATIPGAKPPRAPIPAEVAKKQEDERLLVSDLLEIGQAQRKANEDAQKNANERTPPAKPASNGTAKR
jgi:hypothetical protein